MRLFVATHSRTFLGDVYSYINRGIKVSNIKTLRNVGVTHEERKSNGKIALPSMQTKS